jgi:cytochrome c556
MKVSVLATALITVVGITWVIGADDDTPADREQSVMEQKLSRAQGILSGLAKEDFAAISRESTDLLALAQQQWIEHDTPEYRAQLKDFWITLEGIDASAKEKNLDGATLGYMQLTLSCVKCHKYLRSTQQTE